jgi:hypothetical protein
VWLVLCEHGDASVAWARPGLVERGLEPLEVVTPELLVYARRWEHRVGAGDVYSNVWLADGRRVTSADVEGVLNRLVAPLQPPLGFATADDQDYARHEITALVASWLNGFACPVLNRPPGHGVSGPWLQVPEWLRLGHDVGLTTVPYARDSAIVDEGDPLGPLLADGQLANVIVVGSQVVGAPPHLGGPCVELARLVGAELLGMTFKVSGDGPPGAWAFVVANPAPDLTEGGPRLLDLLAAAMGRRR